MNKFKYVMTMYSENLEQEWRVNDPIALLDMLQELSHTGNHIDVIDGFTGEVLCILNHPNPYMQEEFSLMVLGRLMEQVWGG